jgi:AraC-like DNA-binding protein
VRANPALGQVLHEAARELLDRGAQVSDLERSVRDHVRSGLAHGAVDARSVARAMHMSERTLRRRLEAEHIGLRELIDDVRRELALQLLSDPQRSTEAIAAELGFTTAQAFHRAFKRWTGATIQAHRARAAHSR